MYKRQKQKKLRDRELNPGLPRDRRGYSPLYYRGCAQRPIQHLCSYIYLFINKHTRYQTHVPAIWKLYLIQIDTELFLNLAIFFYEIMF